MRALSAAPLVLIASGFSLAALVPALPDPLVAPAPKGDRLRVADAAPQAPRGAVRTVEIVGVGEVSVILRGADGAVLYHADAARNTTVVARDTALPVVTVKERGDAPLTVAPSAAPAAAPASPPAPARRRALPAGCESPVGVLAGPNPQRPSLCLAALAPDRSS